MFKIYTAGAMEAYKNSNKAEIWRKNVRDYFNNDKDVMVINPVDFYRYGSDYSKSDREIFEFDLHKLRSCDLVLVNLNDIRKSIGTCIEVYEAHKIGIPVVGFIDELFGDFYDKDLINKIHPWVHSCINRIETGSFAMQDALEYINSYYVL